MAQSNHVDDGDQITHLVRYEITVEEIRALVAPLGSLEADTKEGYEAVRQAIAKLRTTRTGIEKTRKRLKAGALAYERKVDAIAKELTAAIEPTEEALQAKKDAVDEAKERAKAEAEAEKRRVLEAELAETRKQIEAERAKLEEDKRKLAEQQAEFNRQQAEQRAREEAERAKEEAARRAEEERVRLERLRPDSEKIRAVAPLIRDIMLPAVESQEARDFLAGIRTGLGNLADIVEAFGKPVGGAS